MNENIYWQNFINSGKIEDYLKYKQFKNVQEGLDEQSDYIREGDSVKRNKNQRE